MFAPERLLARAGDLVGFVSCAGLPACCTVCNSLLSQFSETPVCDACWSEVGSEREHCCARCGEDLFTPASDASGRSECRVCRMAPPFFVRAVSYGVYEGSMRGVIHAMKYERIGPLAKELGRRLAEAIELLGTDVPMLVVPVPLHRSRVSQRGFNQARELAVEALKVLAVRRPEWELELSGPTLMRQRATESMAGLTPRQRRLNLRGAFVVLDPGKIRGRHVLLVDDIYTSGATARGCSKTLIEAGAASVRVVTLARAQRRVPQAAREQRRYLQVAAEKIVDEESSVSGVIQ